jgi:hypothetical protein
LESPGLPKKKGGVVARRASEGDAARRKVEMEEEKEDKERKEKQKEKEEKEEKEKEEKEERKWEEAEEEEEVEEEEELEMKPPEKSISPFFLRAKRNSGATGKLSFSQTSAHTDFSLSPLPSPSPSLSLDSLDLPPGYLAKPPSTFQRSSSTASLYLDLEEEEEEEEVPAPPSTLSLLVEQLVKEQPSLMEEEEGGEEKQGTEKGGEGEGGELGEGERKKSPPQKIFVPRDSFISRAPPKPKVRVVSQHFSRSGPPLCSREGRSEFLSQFVYKKPK